MEILTAKKENIKKIVGSIAEGKVIVVPTDTVYGLVCDASNKEAVERIFSIKKRDKSKSLLVFVKDIEAAKDLALVNEKEEEFLRDNKTTVILEAKDKTLSPLVYKDDTIGVRIPRYEFLNLILEGFKKPLAQTSANISRGLTTTRIKEVLEIFRSQDIQPDIILNVGNLSKNKPSKIVDLSRNREEVLRY